MTNNDHYNLNFSQYSFFYYRNYVLNYLATRPKLENFVIQALVTLFARITKLGWFDCYKEEFVFRNVINNVSNFLQVIFLFYYRYLYIFIYIK